MTAVSIALVGVNAMLAILAAVIVRKRWIRYVALSCAAAEIIGVCVMVSFIH